MPQQETDPTGQVEVQERCLDIMVALEAINPTEAVHPEAVLIEMAQVGERTGAIHPEVLAIGDQAVEVPPEAQVIQDLHLLPEALGIEALEVVLEALEVLEVPVAGPQDHPVVDLEEVEVVEEDNKTDQHKHFKKN